MYQLLSERGQTVPTRKLMLRSQAPWKWTHNRPGGVLGLVQDDPPPPLGCQIATLVNTNFQVVPGPIKTKNVVETGMGETRCG